MLAREGRLAGYRQRNSFLADTLRATDKRPRLGVTAQAAVTTSIMEHPRKGKRSRSHPGRSVISSERLHVPGWVPPDPPTGETRRGAAVGFQPTSGPLQNLVEVPGYCVSIYLLAPRRPLEAVE